MSRRVLILCMASIVSFLLPLVGQRSADAGHDRPVYDVDANGHVGVADILALADHLHRIKPESRNPQFDFDNSGAVDAADTAALVAHIRMLRAEEGANGQHTSTVGTAPAENQTAGITTSIDLVPQTSGPYAPGSSVDVDVILTNREGLTIQPRLVTLDFGATDGALSLP